MRFRSASFTGRGRVRGAIAGVALALGVVAPVVVATTLVVSPLTQHASAAPADAEDGVAVALADLGGSPDIFLARDGSPSLVTVPVPDGMSADSLTGRLTVPSDLREGWVEVSSEGERLQRIAVSSADVDNGLEFSVPLAGVKVVDRSLTVSVASRYVPVDDRCYDEDAFAPFSLRETAVNYSGMARQPETVAEFFPALLRKLTIFVPREADQAAQTAALTLGAQIVHAYDPQPVQVEIAELPAGGGLPPIATELFERNVALGPAEDGAISLERTADGLPVLSIVGDEQSLLPQVQLLAANFQEFRSGTAATSRTEDRSPEIVPDSVTLDQLGVNPLTASGLSHFGVSLPITQSRLGRPVEDLSARLFGTYVPLPGSRSGSVSVRMGSTQLVSQPMDETGEFDFDVEVPAELLSREMTLSVDADVTGDFDCDVSDGSSITVDPRSLIESKVADTPLPGGFQSLPQALLPSMAVGLKDGGLADLRRAALLIVELQRMSYQPLSPEVSSFEEAASSQLPTLLVAAQGGIPDSLELPIDTVDPVLLNLNGVASNEPVATLQTARDGGRTLIVASSNGDAADVDALLAWAQAEKRVQGLTGDLLVGPRGETPFSLAVNVSTAPGTFAGNSDDGLSGAAIVGIVAGTGVLIVAAVGGTVWMRRRDS